jgi:hypothetical protein
MEFRATDPPLPTRIRKAPVKIPNAPPGFASGAISYPGQPGEIKVAELPRRKVTTARTFVRTYPTKHWQTTAQDQYPKLTSQQVLDLSHVPEASCTSCGYRLYDSTQTSGESHLVKGLPLGSKAVRFAAKLDEELPKIVFQYTPWSWAIRGFDDDSVPYTLEPNEVSLFLEEEQQRFSEFFARYPPSEEDTMAKNLSDIEALLNQILRELADEDIIEYERDLLARRLQIIAKNSVQMQVGIIFYDMGIPNTECCRQQIANDSRTRLGDASRDPDCAWRFITIPIWEEDDYREKCGHEMGDLL